MPRTGARSTVQPTVSRQSVASRARTWRDRRTGRTCNEGSSFGGPPAACSPRTIHIAGGEELGRLELLSDDLRLRLGAAPRGVETLERQEHDEPEEHGEPGREDTEDSGGAVAVLEVAPRRGAATNEQHRGDRDRRDRCNDQTGPEEAHDSRTGPRASDPGIARTTVCILTPRTIDGSQ